MAPCLDNLISIKGLCDNDESISGVDLFDLPGMSIEKASAAAGAKAVSGKNLLIDKVRIATLKMKNDLMTFLHGNGYIPNLTTNIFKTGEPPKRPSLIDPANGGQYRGIQIRGAYGNTCIMKKLFVSQVYIKSNLTGAAVMRVEDGNDIYDYDIQLHAGQTDIITINFTAKYTNINILLADTLGVYSVEPNCGCGTQSNGCAKTVGLSGAVTTNLQGYGIYADVQCICDYDEMLCKFVKMGILGEILKYGAGIEIMDEITKSDRLNYFTIYGKEAAQETKIEWSGEYANLWNTFIKSLYKILPGIDRCGCIDCGGTQIKSNV